MKVGDLVKIRENLHVQVDNTRVKGYGVIVDIHGGDMAKVIWQGLACAFSYEMLHDLVNAANELVAFKGS